MVDNLKVVIMSKHDYAGSGYRISQAVNTVDGITATHVRGATPRNKFGYAYGIQLATGGGGSQAEIAQQAINEADIIHFKGDDPPRHKWWAPIKIPHKTPKIITVGGSHFRRQRYRVRLPKVICMGTWPMFEYIKETSARVALTPDLNYPQFEGVWVPAPIDAESVKNTWSVGDEFIIGHSPSTRSKKGTDPVLLPAIDLVREAGYRISLDMIENVSNRECVSRKKKLSIFWGQSVMGAYGNSSLEAMQFGIPTMCWMSEESMKWSGGQLDDCPVVNFEPTPEGCARAIMSIIESDMADLSKRTRDWTVKNHGYKAVGERYHQIYRSVLS